MLGAVLVVSLVGLTLCEAIVVGYPGEDDGLDHTQADPLRAPMLDHVGQLGRHRSGSAVYLGNKWIITAYHAFDGRGSDVVIFGGMEYELDPKRAVQLSNPKGSGLGPETDLVMVPLRSAPDLPRLKISETTPFAGEVVVLIGCGETSLPSRLTPLTDSGEDSRVVRPISDQAANAASDRSGPRWGENRIADRSLVSALPGTRAETHVFATVRQPHWQEHNAQGASGDSGGGVFVNRGDRWEL